MWTPPAVVLRPLAVGERIDAAFKIWTRNFLPMAKAMLVIAVPAGIVEALVTLSMQPATTTTQIGSTSFTSSTGDSAAVLGGTAVNLVIGVFVSALSITTLFRIVTNAYLGQTVDWREALRAGARRMLSAVWISVLIGLVVLLPVAVVVLLVIVAARAGSGGGAALIGLVVGIPAIGLIVWFETCSHLATPVLMLEDVRGSAAIRRAIRLVRGTWWSVFGTLLLMSLIVGIGGLLVGVVFGIIILAGHGDPTTTVISNFFLRTIVLVVFTPLSAALYVVLTIDMRVRKEGFDIELLAATTGTLTGPGALSFIRPQAPYGPPGGYGPGGYGPGGYGPGGYGPGGYGPGGYSPTPQPEPPPPPPFVMPGQPEPPPPLPLSIPSLPMPPPPRPTADPPPADLPPPPPPPASPPPA